MNTSSLLTRGTVLLGVVLLGAGCSATEEFANCFKETAWGSCVNFNGIDEALIGSWTLASEVVDTPVSTPSNPTGIITNPFSGRTVIFGIDTRPNSVTGELESYGVYSEDYSTENVPDVWMSSCEALGTAGGTYRSEVDVDLDNYDPASPDPVPLIAELRIYPIGQNVSVVCRANGEPIRSSEASTPFGTGKGAVDSVGAHVPYTYTLSDDWSTLIMNNTNSITNVVLTYTFTRN